MMSKLRSAVIVVSVAATTSSLRSPGRVTDLISRQKPAPSMRAASYRVVGIFCTPARNSTMHSPNSIQVPIQPIEVRAQSKFAIHACSNRPRPTAPSALLSGPTGS